jgi:hypothetical protein
MSDDERETKPFKFVTGKEASFNYLGKNNRMIANCLACRVAGTLPLSTQSFTTDPMRDG